MRQTPVWTPIPPKTGALFHAYPQTWRRLKGDNLLSKVVAGVTFKDGTEVTDVPEDRAA